MKVMPQELEIWYLIPALRKEITKILISDFAMSQRQASETIELTESAVSQYLKSKRGNELKFSKEQMKEINETARKIVEKGNANEELYKLCVKFRGSENLCDLHRKQDPSISKDCDLCVLD